MARKILVVARDRVDRDALTSVLSGAFDATGKSPIEVVDYLNKKFINVSAVVVDVTSSFYNDCEIIRRIRTHAVWAPIPIVAVVADAETKEKAYAMGANGCCTKPYRTGELVPQLKNLLRLCESSRIVNNLLLDKLTGIYNREAFIKEAEARIKSHSAGFYVLSCLDIENFKMLNDHYGTEKGDEVLKYVAASISRCVEKWGGICCRFMADKFAVLYPTAHMDSEDNLENHHVLTLPPCLEGHSIKLRVGRYIVDDTSLPVSMIYDRATLAEGSIKGRYDEYIAVYNESMRDRLLREQQIIGEMHRALEEKHFEVWFQPQYNHVSGKRIGAEALVRWRHPEKGLISPADFIPIFERNGFIYELDKFVWKTVCGYLRRWTDEEKYPLPVSVNVSRYDMYQPDFYDFITGLMEKYRLPMDMLCLEVTESAFSVSAEQIIQVVRDLRSVGFTVEIDDFGSGYSSLNILKDVPAGVLKLDMHFLAGANTSQRGGRILESIIRMARWLDMPVIAEGVETKAQADYLCTLGCERIQGYLYARPMPAAEFEKLPIEKTREELYELRTIKYLGGDAFWNPDSIETMVFSHFSGGACIFEIKNYRLELLRINSEFPKAFRTTLSEREILRLEPFSSLNKEEKARLLDTISRAVDSGMPEECEIFSTLYSEPGEYVHFTIRLVASNDDRYLFYGYVENITAQRLAEKKAKDLAVQMQAVIDNMYSGVSAVSIADGEYKFLLANDLFYEQYGYSREQFAEEVKTPYTLVLPEDKEKVRQVMNGVHTSGKPDSVIYRIRRRDGVIRWIESHVSIVSFPDTKGLVQLTATNDITSQQELSEHLRFLNDMAHELLEQEDTEKGINATLRRLMDYFSGKRAYIFEFDYDDGTCSNTYEVCAEGVTAEKDTLQGLPIEVMSFWLNAFEKQKHVFIENVEALDDSRAEEKEILLAQGIKSLIAIPLTGNGELLGFFGIDDGLSHNVLVDELTALGDYLTVKLTRRNMTEKILRDNDNVRRMMDDSPGGFNRLRIMPDKSIVGVYANKEFARMLGMTVDELTDMYHANAWWGVHPDDMAALTSTVAAMVKDFETKELKYRLRNKNGDFIKLHAYGRAMKDELGDLYLNVFYADLTEDEKRTERQRELLDNLPCGAGICETDGKTAKMLYLNKKYYSYFKNDVAGRSEKSAFSGVHPDDLILLMETMNTVRLGATEGGCVIRIADGEEYISFRLFGTSTGDNNGQTVIYVTFTPISNERLSFSEMLPITLAEVIGSSKSRMFLKDKNFRYVLCNKPFANSIGYDDERDIIGKTDFDLINSHDAKQFRADDERVVNTKRALPDYETLHTAADGTMSYSNTSRYPLLDSKGNIIGIFCIARDVTDSKKKDAQLKLMTNCIPGGLATYVCTAGDLSSAHVRITYFNDGFCRLFGYTREEYDMMSSINPASLIFEEDRYILTKQLQALISNGTPIDCLYRVRVKGGGYKWISHRAEASSRDGGSVTVNAMLVDMTKQQAEAERLRISEEENRLAILHSGTVICHFDIPTRIMTLAVEVAEKFGVPPTLKDVPDGPIVGGMVSSETKNVFKQFFEDIIGGTPEGNATFKFSVSGEWRWQRAHYSTVFDDMHKPLFAVISMFDVTDQLEKEAAYIKWKQSLRERDTASYSLYRCNISRTSAFETVGGHLLQISPDDTTSSYAAVTKGYAAGYVHEDDRERYEALLDAGTLLSDFYRGKRTVSLEYRERLAGGVRWLKVTIELLEYPNSSDIEAYLMYEDIDETKRATLRIRELADTDFLTGLLNRKAFIEKLSAQLKTKKKTLSALFMLDLDGFKMVNDCFGHIVGDNTLVEMAQRLRSIFRKHDLVCRLGGDEFLAFLDDVPGINVIVEKAKQICTVIRKTFSVEVGLSASVGVVVIPNDGDDFDTLYHKADIALYHVKSSGKNNCAFFDEAMAAETPHLRNTPEAGKEEAKRRMLIVEDNGISRELLVNMFKDKFIVDTAEDGESALKRLKRYGYSLSVVLLDLVMPNMDGFDVLKTMRESADTASIPVVVVSGLNERETSLKAIKYGASDFVTKPVDPDLLWLRVQSAVAKAENERLRAQNRLLSVQSAEVQRMRTALGSSGTVLATYDEDSGAFEYDGTLPLYIAGKYDSRSILDIFISDKVASKDEVAKLRLLMNTLKKDKTQFSGTLTMQLRTPDGKKKPFVVRVIPLEGEGTDGRRLMTFTQESEI